jgi:hypothetical protein
MKAQTTSDAARGLTIKRGWRNARPINGKTPQDDRPDIQISAALKGMVDAAEAALLKFPGPGLYQRARQIVRVAPAGKAPAWLQRPPDAPIITPVSVAALREYAADAATWTKYDKRAKEWQDTLPSRDVLETLAA